MSSFLVVYNQTTGKVERFTEFGSAQSERLAALKARLEVETCYADRPEIEVVVLNAASEAALRRSHGRYFNSAHQLADRLAG